MQSSLQIGIYVTMLGSLVALIVAIIYGGALSQYILAGMYVGSFGAYFFLRRNSIVLSSVMVLASISVAATALVIASDTVFDEAILIFPGLILFGCIILTKRAFFAFMLLTGMLLNAAMILRPVLHVGSAAYPFEMILNINIVLAAISGIIMVIIKDVSDRYAELRVVNEALVTSEFRVRTLLESIPSVFIHFSADGRILFSNVRNKFPKTKDPRYICDLLPGDGNCKEQLTDMITKVTSHQFEDSLSIHWKFSDDEDKKIYSTIVSKYSDSNDEYIALVTDITETRLLEQRLEKLQKTELIGALAGSITHDFNNMLNLISLQAGKILRKFSGNDSLRSDIQIIQDSTMNAAALTKKMLQLGRNEQQSHARLQLNDVVTEMERILRRLVDKDIAITLDLQEDLPSVRSHQVDIEQILMNLVINARDAIRERGKDNPKKEILITTYGARYEQLPNMALKNGHVGPCVILSVKDTGAGIPADIQEKIFDPFFSTKGSDRGTGLGLSTIRDIVKKHGATIGLQSTVSVGTTFTIAFPEFREVSLPAVNAPVPEQLSIAASSEKPEEIVIIDDSPDILLIFKRFLEKVGYRVQTFQAVETFYAFVEEKKPNIDLLVTDYFLIDSTGQSVIQRVRTQYPSIPIILISGYSLTKLDIDLKAFAPIEFHQKPISPRKISERIVSMLRQQSVAA